MKDTIFHRLMFKIPKYTWRLVRSMFRDAIRDKFSNKHVKSLVAMRETAKEIFKSLTVF